jgi:hypothetical protein
MNAARRLIYETTSLYALVITLLLAGLALPARSIVHQRPATLAELQSQLAEQAASPFRRNVG